MVYLLVTVGTFTRKRWVKSLECAPCVNFAGARCCFISRILMLTFAFTVFFLIVSAFAQSPRILIYSATRGFRHDSIPTAIEALQNASNAINLRFDSTEDQALFNDPNLARYDAILFLSTTGEGEFRYEVGRHTPLNIKLRRGSPGRCGESIFPEIPKLRRKFHRRSLCLGHASQCDVLRA